MRTVEKKYQNYMNYFGIWVFSLLCIFKIKYVRMYTNFEMELSINLSFNIASGRLSWQCQKIKKNFFSRLFIYEI